MNNQVMAISGRLQRIIRDGGNSMPVLLMGTFICIFFLISLIMPILALLGILTVEEALGAMAAANVSAIAFALATYIFYP